MIGPVERAIRMKPCPVPVVPSHITLKIQMRSDWFTTQRFRFD